MTKKAEFLNEIPTQWKNVREYVEGLSDKYTYKIYDAGQLDVEGVEIGGSKYHLTLWTESDYVSIISSLDKNKKDRKNKLDRLKKDMQGYGFDLAEVYSLDGLYEATISFKDFDEIELDNVVGLFEAFNN